MAKYLPVLLFLIFTPACGSLQLDAMTTAAKSETSVNGEVADPIIADFSLVETSAPTPEVPAEGFHSLWVEYRDPKYGYGIALPAHWELSATPIDSEGGGYMTTRSYDLEYFGLHSIKGNWIDGVAPEGAVKLDFVVFEDIVAERSLSAAASEILGKNQDETLVLSIEEITLGANNAALISTARPYNQEDVFTSVVFRLSPDKILLVAAYPNTAMNSMDVQAIFHSLVLNGSTPIIKPGAAPHEPFS